MPLYQGRRRRLRREGYQQIFLDRALLGRVWGGNYGIHKSGGRPEIIFNFSRGCCTPTDLFIENVDDGVAKVWKWSWNRRCVSLSCLENFAANSAVRLAIVFVSASFFLALIVLCFFAFSFRLWYMASMSALYTISAIPWRTLFRAFERSFCLS